jgi:hypothetical protein
MKRRNRKKNFLKLSLLILTDMSYAAKYKKISPNSRRNVQYKLSLSKSFVFLSIGCVVTSFLLYNIFKVEEKVVESDQVIDTTEIDIEADVILEETSNLAVNKVSEFQEAVVRGRSGYFAGGNVRRSFDGRNYKVAILVDLPPHEDQYFAYEAWMVRPGVMEYFSLGEFVKRADGKYGLIHESIFPNIVDEIQAYTRLIVTREPRDGNRDPSPIHVAEANF